MSFSSLELARVIEEFKKTTSTTPLVVQGVSLVSFPLQEPIADINLALQFTEHTLVFSLTSPWVGMFWLASSHWIKSDTVWEKAFSRTHPFEKKILNSQLISVSQIEKDRIVECTFSTGDRLYVELIPAKPNWIFKSEKEIFWKTPTHSKHLYANQTTRDFLEYSGASSWMERAYLYYFELRKKQLFESLLHTAKSELKKKQKKIAQKKIKLIQALDKTKNIEKIFQEAEALKIVQHQYPKAKKLFDQYKKLLRTKKEVELQLEVLEQNLSKIINLEATLNNWNSDKKPELLQLQVWLYSEGLIKKWSSQPLKTASRETKKTAQLTSFTAKDGCRILIGRKQSENEKIVMRLSRGNDLWLHLKGTPGAHGLIQIPKGKTASLETILDAATLVAYYSKIAVGNKVEVDYTFRKYIKRAPKVEKFLIIYAQNKTLLLTVEASRLEKLLSKEQ